MFLITNSFSTIKLVGTLCVLFHFFACCWIYIGQFKYFDAEGWRTGVDVTDSSKWTATYVEGWYFVTTTATTIGYGDYYGVTIYERSFIIVLMFCGICIFSTITGNIRGLKFMVNFQEAINQRIQDVNYFIFQID